MTKTRVLRQVAVPCPGRAGGVYVWATATRVLYFGQSGDVFGRIKGHARVRRAGADRLLIVPLPRADVMQREAVEGLVIDLLRPQFNVRLPGQYARDPGQAVFLARMFLRRRGVEGLVLAVEKNGWQANRGLLADLLAHE